MDYEKKYNEAVCNIQKLLENGRKEGEVICAYEADFMSIFPELKGSKDERIRQRIIHALHGDVLEMSEIKEATDWLEKQAEHANFRNKIQIGDKVTRNEGGVLVNISQLNRVAKERKKQGEQKHLEEGPEKWSEVNTPMSYGKELEDKKNEACRRFYSQDEDAFNLAEVFYSGVEAGKELVEQKPEWSEEDKKLIDDTCHLINTLASGYGEKVTEPITLSGTQMIESIKDRLRALVDK